MSNKGDYLPKKKIPHFKTLTDEAKFWDTHDITDYIDEFKSTSIDFSKTDFFKEETISIRVQTDFKKRLQKVAQYYHLSISSLARMFLIDKLREFEAKIVK